MKTRKQSCRADRGSALLIVLGIIAMIASALGVTYSATSQRVFLTRKLADRTRALMYAEAGVHHAYTVLTEDWSQKSTTAAFPPTAYGMGSYDVTVTPLTNEVAVVRSVGVCRSADATVVVDLKNFGRSGTASGPADPPEGSAWEHTIFSNGEISLRGSGNVKGSIHGNAAVMFGGSLNFFPGPIDVSSSTEIEVNGGVMTPGSLTAPTIRISGGNGGGCAVQETAVPSVPFPDLDLTPYYNTAVANGQVFTGGVYDEDVDWTSVPGGVVWIEGDLNLQANAVLDGIVIATGMIQMTANQSWTSAPGGSCWIISRDSGISLSGGVQLDGLLMARGNIALGGNVGVNGQIIGGSDVLIHGTVDVVSYVYVDEPGFSIESATTPIGVLAWQR